MKLKNYKWNGFGFPVIFAELPAAKIRGELVPDVDWTEVGRVLMTFICTQQEVPLSGSQIRFIRHGFQMSLREFAKFVGVKHQSVMRWEERKNQPAKVEAHIEIVLRIKVLRGLDANEEQIEDAFDQVDDVARFQASTYKTFRPLKVPEAVIHAHF